MKASVRRCALSLCLASLTWATPGAATHTSDVGVTLKTQWLRNGLRLVTLARPNGGLVSVRLLIRGGTLDVPPGRMHLPHLVEHLAFNSTDLADVSGRVAHGGGWTAAWTQHHRVVHEFDVPAHAGRRMLREIRLQWGARGFPEQEVEKEIKRILHEMGCSADPMLTQLAIEYAPQSALAGSARRRIKDVESISAKEAWDHFQETYVGARMTLVVVAPASTLDDLDGILQEYGAIPAGRLAEPPTLGELSWLSGQLRAYSTANRFGMWFSVPHALGPVERCLLVDAAAEYVREQLTMRSSFAYDVDFSSYDASDATVWMFEPIVNRYVNSAEQAAAEGRRALFALAEEGPWWEDFRESRAVGCDAGLAVELASLTPHGEPLPDELPADLPTAGQLQMAYRRTVHSAVWFDVVRKEPGTNPEPEERGPISVAALWFVHEIFEEPSWRSPLPLGYVLGLAVAVALILRRGAVRVRNAAVFRK